MGLNYTSTLLITELFDSLESSESSEIELLLLLLLLFSISIFKCVESFTDSISSSLGFLPVKLKNVFVNFLFGLTLLISKNSIFIYMYIKNLFLKNAFCVPVMVSFTFVYFCFAFVVAFHYLITISPHSICIINYTYIIILL